MGISEAVHQEISRSFSAEDADQVVTTLTNASDAIAGSERIQFAVLKLAKGDLQEFNKAFDLASSDWRDVLMAAGMEEMDWPDVVVEEGMADENWRNGVISGSQTGVGKDKKESKPWWQFW